MVAPFGRQATLTMIISYNDSDWTTGWNHLLKGATMFLTPSYEQEWDYLFFLLDACTKDLCPFKDARSGWFNCSKSKWNSCDYIQKTTTSTSGSTVRKLPATKTIWIDTFRNIHKETLFLSVLELGFEYFILRKFLRRLDLWGMSHTVWRRSNESRGSEIIQWKDWQNWSRMQLYIEFTPCQSKPRKATEGVHFCETICLRIEIC